MALHVVLIGHVDHGKSTLAGRLLYELGLVSEAVIEEYRRQAAALRKKTYEFAWVMDASKESRYRGLTMTLAYRKITLNNRRIIIVDAPGQPNFVAQTIRGIAESDACVLVVSAKEGIQFHTRQHSEIAWGFGLNQIIIAINKMDIVDYSEKRFKELKASCTEMLLDIGYSREAILGYIPVSAYYGENVTTPSSRMLWYDGPTFLDSLSSFAPKAADIEAPFRMPVDAVFSIKGTGVVVAGKVVAGRVRKGDRVVIAPQTIKARVKSIEEFHEPLEEATVGDDVGIALSDVGREGVEVGSVIGEFNNPPPIVRRFLAKVRIVDPPSVAAFHVGYAPVVAVHSQICTARVAEIVSRIDPDTDEVLERPPELTSLGPGDVGYVEFQMDAPLVIEPGEAFPSMGRFIIWDQRRVVAVGTCVENMEI